MKQSKSEKIAFHNLGTAGHNYCKSIECWDSLAIDISPVFKKALVPEAKKNLKRCREELKQAARDFVAAEKMKGAVK